jgi:hypothetical protein
MEMCEKPVLKRKKNGYFKNIRKDTYFRLEFAAD